MKRFWIPGLVATFELLLAGCFSVDVATSSNFRNFRINGGEDRPLAHLVVSNYGWYLFGSVPVVCGNAREEARLPWAFFRDDVQPAILHNRFNAIARSQNCTVNDMFLCSDDSIFFELPLVNVSVPIPYLVCYREHQLSGTLVPLAGSGNGKEGAQ